MAHCYAAAPEDFVFHDVSLVPWPTTLVFKWAPVSAKDLRPRTLIDLCIPDEKLECVLSVGAKRSTQGDQREVNDLEGDGEPPPGLKVIPPWVDGGSNKAASNSSKTRKTSPDPKIRENKDTEPPNGGG